MRTADTYRGARRNRARKEPQPAKGFHWWPDGAAIQANTEAKLSTRHKIVALGRKTVAAALAQQEVLFKGARADIVALLAWREHWANVTGLKRRLVRRMVQQLDLDLRSARA